MVLVVVVKGMKQVFENNLYNSICINNDDVYLILHLMRRFDYYCSILLRFSLLTFWPLRQRRLLTTQHALHLFL